MTLVHLGPGDTFGRYTIEALLGEGGMGSVYRAVDTKLERRVALKLLRRALSPDPAARAEAAARLLREARAVALIDHPNAVAVHDVGEVGDTPYIAMELVVGRSLRTYVGDASVPSVTRVRWLADVARALAAAHARGLVHRDVKPENVMVRDDGAIKVLDFGIAWRRGGAPSDASESTGWRDSDQERWHATLSIDGAVVGTPRYISPEQLNGREADGRADQFAWGVMAYELLAGVPPWPGETVSYSALLDTLEKEPIALGRAAVGLSREMEGLVHRAMNKDPEERFATMDTLLEALRATREARGPRTRASRRATLLLSATAALAVAGVALYVARAPPTPLSFHPVNVRRVTFSDACEEYPSFTPDGKRLAFDEVRGSNLVIVTKDLASGAERAITDSDGWDLAPYVSPDGTQVAFLRAPRESTPHAMIAAMDGKRAPRTICEGWMRPAFSPDGSALWCGEPSLPTRVDLATGSVTRKLEMPPSVLAVQVHELRDGRVLALAPGGEPTAVQGLGVFEHDGSMRWLARDNFLDALDVTPDERYAITARLTPTGSREIVAVPIAGGAVVPIAGADIAPSQGVRVAPDGKTIAWSTCHEVTSLVRVNEQGTLVPLHETHAWKESAASPIPGSRKLVVLSERGGENAPWVVDRDEREPPRMLHVPGSPRSVSVSPDGRLAALAITGHGIMIASIDGESTRALTSEAADGKPRFLRDGRAVAFVRAVAGGARRVFVVDVNGGEPRPLLGEGSSDPSPSPVDDRIAYLAGTEMTKKVPMIFDVKTGQSQRLSPQLGEGSYESLAFSGDGRRVGFLGGAAQSTIVEVDVATGAVARTIDAGTSTLFRLAYDGTEPIAGRSQWVGNLWLADGRF